MLQFIFCHGLATFFGSMLTANVSPCAFLCEFHFHAGVTMVRVLPSCGFMVHFQTAYAATTPEKQYATTAQGREGGRVRTEFLAIIQYFFAAIKPVCFILMKMKSSLPS